MNHFFMFCRVHGTVRVFVVRAAHITDARASTLAFLAEEYGADESAIMAHFSSSQGAEYIPNINRKKGAA